MTETKFGERASTNERSCRVLSLCSSFEYALEVGNNRQSWVAEFREVFQRVGTKREGTELDGRGGYGPGTRLTD